MGNPQGLKHSVVSGVVSGTREIDGRTMLQLADSRRAGQQRRAGARYAGPRAGHRHDEVARHREPRLCRCRQRPQAAASTSPIPCRIDRWLTIGAIDRTQWEPLFGARWQQRAGRILVDGLGAGFGGRSLLLAKSEPPRVALRAGRAASSSTTKPARRAWCFTADGGDKHYGFYPSNGKLRLSRFEGPDVFSWQVLAEKPSEHYRPGEWNRLKVRVEKDKLQCFVNDELVIESTDDGFTTGRVGLAKFRNTGAEFRRFAVAKELPSDRPDCEALAKLAGADRQAAAAGRGRRGRRCAALAQPNGERCAGAAAGPGRGAGSAGRGAEAAGGRRADRGRSSPSSSSSPGRTSSKIDLLRAALTIARLDDEDLDVEAYVKHVERMADEIKQKLPAKADRSRRSSRR